MLDYINGKVISSSQGVVVVEAGNIGFRAAVPGSFSQKLTAGEMVRVYVSLSLKNEEVKMYGFASPDDRKMFEKFQTVSGIGPVTALHILSSAPLATIYEAILAENVTLFTKIKGIGMKTAKRIVLELKEKLSKEEFVASGAPTSTASLQGDAIEALKALGYTQELAWQAVTKAIKSVPENASVDMLVREALKQTS